MGKSLAVLPQTQQHPETPGEGTSELPGAWPQLNYLLDLMSKLGKVELRVPLLRGRGGGQLSPQAWVVCSNHV